MRRSRSTGVVLGVGSRVGCLHGQGQAYMRQKLRLKPKYVNIYRIAYINPFPTLSYYGTIGCCAPPAIAPEGPGYRC